MTAIADYERAGGHTIVTQPVGIVSERLHDSVRCNDTMPDDCSGATVDDLQPSNTLEHSNTIPAAYDVNAAAPRIGPIEVDFSVHTGVPRTSSGVAAPTIGVST